MQFLTLYGLPVTGCPTLILKTLNLPPLWLIPHLKWN